MWHNFREQLIYCLINFYCLFISHNNHLFFKYFRIDVYSAVIAKMPKILLHLNNSKLLIGIEYLSFVILLFFHVTSQYCFLILSLLKIFLLYITLSMCEITHVQNIQLLSELRVGQYDNSCPPC